MSAPAVVNRRAFLRAGGAGLAGLVVAFTLPERSKLAAQRGGPQRAVNPNAYIHIAPDESVTFIVTKAEMGQGTVTSLSMLLGEESDCDWTKVRTEFAPVDPSLYGQQGVFGSNSIRSCYGPLRQAGAAARAMLVEAAARKWNVDAASLRTENGFVLGGNGARASYGSLAEAAGQLPVPANVALKDPKQFKIIGTAVKRLDTPAKVNGQAQFGIDARLPGMLYAAVARCPVFGGKVASCDAAKAKAVPGVMGVFQIGDGVAVVAENTWSAFEGRDALEIKWDEGPNAAQNSVAIAKLFASLVEQPGAVARKTGDAEQAMASAAKKIEAAYRAPYLAHAAMEPLNCTAVIRGDACEVWASTQQQGGSRDAAARAAGLKAENVKVNTLYMGGGFGRRTNVDYVGETVEIAKAAGAPVKLTWSREDDMRHDVYRPAAYAKFSGGLGPDGWPVALTARVACPSFFGAGGGFGGGGGVDRMAMEGLDDLEYAIPHVLMDFHRADAGIPTYFWRSVGYSQNTFFGESFLDELAAAGGKDPVEFRRRLLASSPRLLGVLNLAAEKANWGQPAPGRAQGVALVNNIGSYNAQIAEVSVAGGKVRVHRVVCAVDCGRVVNPAIVRQQIEGGIVFGLSAALKGEITIDRGRVVQGNFDEYDVLRIDEMPRIEVYIVPSEANPGGIGEASVPPIAPAVANAIFKATGKRIRSLPIRAEELA